MPRGRPKGSKNKKQIPLSKESKKLVEKGLQEAKEGKLEPLDKKLLEERKEDNKKEENINPNLKRTVNNLTKQFGHEVIHFASEEPEKGKIPFGIKQIDDLIGGGITEGMFTVLWGNKSSVKSTLAYLVIAQAQKKGIQSLYIDLEQSFNKVWSTKMGVNLDTLLIANKSKNAEETFDMIIKLCNEKSVGLIVLDSIQSLSPQGEKETKTGKERSVADDTMALLARKLSQFFRMTASGVASGKVAVLLIGQARTDLGSFIKLDALSSGHALQHWSAITLKTYRGAKADSPRYRFKINDKSKEIIIGFPLNIKIEKTKLSGTAPESSVVTLPFYYEYAFEKPTEEQIKKTFKDWIEFESEE